MIKGSHLLMAVGRKSNIDRLDLDKAGVETTKAGIKVDDSLRSSNRRVYAIGDVAGGLQFTHVAGYHAGVVIRSILFGLPSKTKLHHIPWVTYAAPELAQVGLTEAQAREEHGDKLEVAVPLQPQRPRDCRASDQRVHQGDGGQGPPGGGSIVGHQAGELITLWSLVRWSIR